MIATDVSLNWSKSVFLVTVSRRSTRQNGLRALLTATGNETASVIKRARALATVVSITKKFANRSSKKRAPQRTQPTLSCDDVRPNAIARNSSLP